VEWIASGEQGSGPGFTSELDPIRPGARGAAISGNKGVGLREDKDAGTAIPIQAGALVGVAASQTGGHPRRERDRVPEFESALDGVVGEARGSGATARTTAIAGRTQAEMCPMVTLMVQRRKLTGELISFFPALMPNAHCKQKGYLTERLF